MIIWQQSAPMVKNVKILEILKNQLEVLHRKLLARANFVFDLVTPLIGHVLDQFSELSLLWFHLRVVRNRRNRNFAKKYELTKSFRVSPHRTILGKCFCKTAEKW